MTVDYEKAKRIAKNGTYAERAALAADQDAPPEILVFLAADSSPSVRAALANNPKLPIHAIKLLASDAEQLVRLGIAQQTLNIWSERQHSNPVESELAHQALELLAADDALAVREALASAIIDIGAAPQQLAQRLALDAAQSVSEPILRGYTQLDDTFLINVLATRSDTWARIAVAAREAVSAEVAEALVRTDDNAVTLALLQNKGATLSGATYDYIEQRMKEQPEWHPPLVERADLPQKIAVRMAEFVDEAVFNVLTVRGDFDAATAREIVQTARRRIDWLEGSKAPPMLRARELYDDGKLTEDAILDAVAWHDEDFIILSLALKSRIHPVITRKMMKSENPKAVMAVAWKAGLSARGGLKLQKSPGNIPPHKLLHPKGGDHYPLDEAEMKWQFDFYGVKI